MHALNKKKTNIQTLTHQVPELMNANSCVDLILDSLNLRTQQETSHTERHMDGTRTHTRTVTCTQSQRPIPRCEQQTTYQSVRIGLTTDN